MTVAPPTRVGSTNTLPSAVFLHERGGRDRRDRAARRAPRSRGWPRPRRASSGVVDGHEDVHALRAARLHRALEPDVGERLAHEVRDARRRPRTASPSGGSRSSTRCVMRSGCSARVSAGWYSIARWFANQISVRRSLQSAYDTLRFDASAHTSTVSIAFRRVLRDVLLHERLLPAMHADHRQRPVLEHRDDAVAHRVEVVDEVALGRVGAVEQRVVEAAQRDALALFLRTRVTGSRHVPRNATAHHEPASLWHTRDATATQVGPFRS